MCTILLTIVLLVAFASATIDLNEHQLQFIADHLDTNECRKLAEMLHHTEYEINASIAITGENEPKKPCIFLLLKWDRTEGYEKTFDRLALRLRQLGRHDLSDFLSKSVLGEDDMKIKENFLGNPFRKQIPSDSVLLDTDSKKKKSNEEASADETFNEDEGLEPWEIASIACGSVILLIISIYVIYNFFGTAIGKLFRNFAPDFIVEWCGLLQGQCKWCCLRAKRKYEIHMTGKRSSRLLTAEERKSVIELNKNLNNYMNGAIVNLSRRSRDRAATPAQDNQIITLHQRNRWIPATRTVAVTIGKHNSTISAKTGIRMSWERDFNIVYQYKHGLVGDMSIYRLLSFWNDMLNNE